MPEILILDYQFTAELWRLAYGVHYCGKRSLTFGYCCGVICICVGSFGLGGLFPSKLLAGLFLATGLFGVLQKQILIATAVRRACRQHFFAGNITVLVSPLELAVRNDRRACRHSWNHFVGYRRRDAGFFLYYTPNAFFFIPTSVLTAGYAKRLEQILEAAEVAKL
ncbi:MAG: YcxB family protein [Desulfuromonadaceae bacterium]|jgi:hypothetical protein